MNCNECKNRGKPTHYFPCYECTSNPETKLIERFEPKEQSAFQKWASGNISGCECHNCMRSKKEGWNASLDELFSLYCADREGGWPDAINGGYLNGLIHRIKEK